MLVKKTIMQSLVPFMFGIWTIWDVCQLSWLCDDAFISFRYAEFFAQGDGLVYNHGEYVEGYTNLLWTVWLAIGIASGFAVETVAHVSSILACIACVFVWHLCTRENRVSLGFFFLVGMFHIRVFATSGLESQWFLLWISLAVLGLWRNIPKLLYTVVVLSMLTRPEGGILWIAGVVALPRRQEKYGLAVIGMVTLLCLEIWRWSTYHAWLPNTFYAKAADANWQQGWLYIWLFIKQYYLVALALVASVWLCTDSSSNPEDKKLGLFSTVFAVIYVLHVARAGGDFMMARFCLPWTVPIVLTGGLVLQDKLRGYRVDLLAGVLIFAIAFFAPRDARLEEIGAEGIGVHGITDEHVWYPEYWRVEAERLGVAAQPFFSVDFGVDMDTECTPSVVIYGGQAMFAYYAKLPYVLEGMAGLTDIELARMHERDSRIGHGRKASVRYLQERGVDLYLDFRIQQSSSSQINHIQLGEVTGSILSYKKCVLDRLEAKGAIFVNFPRYLEEYISENHPIEKVCADYPNFFQYYFRHNTTDPTAMSVLGFFQNKCGEIEIP